MKNKIMLDRSTSSTPQLKNIKKHKSFRKELLSKNIWLAEDIGLKPNAAQSTYLLNFSKINPLWFRDAVKQFVLFQSATKVHRTCRSYIAKLKDFSDFIIKFKPDFQPVQLNRKIILEYLNYVAKLPISASTKRLALIHLRTFIEIVTQEELLPFPNIRLIFSSDLPKNVSSIPRFIPELVMSQLMQHLDSIPDYHRRLIFVLQETGRRISEICTLQFDYLVQDKEMAYFLKISDQKMKKNYLIPITDSCVKVIKEQQIYVRSLNFESFNYLFLSNSKKTKHAVVSQISNVLNNLAKEKQILDSNGKIWRFHPHQFRHTVGTHMINAGVSQPIVQRYLGHETPEMTNRYAYIHDKTLKETFVKFHGNLIGIHGDIKSKNSRLSEEHWLKHNIDTANKNGWHRQVEMNLEIKRNLEIIIFSLNGNSNDKT